MTDLLCRNLRGCTNYDKCTCLHSLQHILLEIGVNTIQEVWNFFARPGFGRAPRCRRLLLRHLCDGLLDVAEEVFIIGCIVAFVRKRIQPHSNKITLDRFRPSMGKSRTHRKTKPS